MFDPVDDIAYLPFTLGTSLTYEHLWSDAIYSKFTYSLLMLEEEAQTGLIFCFIMISKT
jgi:hypothetical protein